MIYNVGKRVLLIKYNRQVSPILEVKIIELSNSNAFCKVKNVITGSEYWIVASDYDLVDTLNDEALYD